MAVIFLIFLVVSSGNANPPGCSKCDDFLGRIIDTNPIRNFVLLHNLSAAPECIHDFYKFKPTFVVNFAANDSKKIHLENLDNSFTNDYNLFFVFLTENYNFYEIFDNITLMNFWKRRYRIIFVGNFTVDEVRSYSKMSFRKHWSTNLVFSDINCSSILRYNPFNKTILASSSPDIVFENTAYNMYGFPLKIVMCPDIVAKWNGSHYLGRDGYMATEIVKKLNATAIYIEFRQRDYGSVFNNGSITGMLNAVYDGTADASFMARSLLSSFFKYADFTYTYANDNIILMLPVKVEEVGNFTHLIPLKILILSAFISGLFSIYLKFFSGLSFGKILIMNIQLISMQAAETVKINSYRMVLISIVLYYFYLSNVFQAKLISALMLRKELPEVTRISEAAETKIKFISQTTCQIMLRTFQGPDKESIVDILTRNTYYTMDDLQVQLSKCMVDRGFMTTYKLSYYFMNQIRDENGFRKKCYYIIGQYAVPFKASFILRYGSPILHKVDKIIQRLVEGGFITYWEEVFHPVFVEKNLNSPKKIGIKNIMSTIGILIVGWLLSILVFLHERGVFVKIRRCFAAKNK